MIYNMVTILWLSKFAKIRKQDQHVEVKISFIYHCLQFQWYTVKAIVENLPW